MIEQHFGESAPWSLGLEEEVQILDRETLALAPAVEPLLGAVEGRELPGELKMELLASIVELATKVCDTPEEALLAAETRERLAEAIEALPATQRAVISLRDIEGWSSDEVRNALDLSETNQRVLLHRARAKVRAALDSYLEQE